jgi:hypothetical protein
MSYCVNCGVELDKGLKECPLCHTPVWNPTEEVLKHTSTFPIEKGTVEVVKRKDLGILLSVFVIGTSVTCGLLNLLVYSTSPWSLMIIGLCVVLWVMAIPALFITKQPIYASLGLDGLAVCLYLYMISFMTKSREWLYWMGLPVAVLVTIVVLLFTVCIRRFLKSFLGIAFCFFTAVGILCIGLEILIDRYSHYKDGLSGHFSLGWSAIVMTVCVILDITIVTLLSRRRLRSAVRRRLHF